MYKAGDLVWWPKTSAPIDCRVFRGRIYKVHDKFASVLCDDDETRYPLLVDLNKIDTQDEFLKAVKVERQRQIQKWGLEWRSPELLIAVLMEEVGEVARAAMENDSEQYLIELVQVAAVACQMYEAYHEREKQAHMIAELEGLKPR